MLGLVKKIFGDSNERELKRMWKAVEYINSLEPSIEVLSDQELRHKTVEFRARLEKGEELDDLLPEHSPLLGRRPNAYSASVITMCS